MFTTSAASSRKETRIKQRTGRNMRMMVDLWAVGMTKVTKERQKRLLKQLIPNSAFQL